MAERITFSAGNLRLEGLLTPGAKERAAIVAHPHPLYGGDMYNPVVETLGELFAERGYTVLRFNFRGVGRSEGRYDDGEGECRDMAAAETFLREGGAARIDVAGYSFGAWVAARHKSRPCGEPGHSGESGGVADAGDLLLVSPPVGLLDFGPVKRLPTLRLAVTGELDTTIASGRMIRERLLSWNPSAGFAEIEGADHFYSGSLGRLKETIASRLGPPWR